MPQLSRSRAFTLIELLIVVTILGVLAAMSLPLLAAVRGDTRRTCTEFTVQELQKAVDLYKVQTGQLPDLITSWAPLTQPNNIGDRSFGPLLSAVPRNLLMEERESTVIEGIGEVFFDQAAFVYDYADGQGSGRIMAATRSRR